MIVLERRNPTGDEHLVIGENESVTLHLRADETGPTVAKYALTVRLEGDNARCNVVGRAHLQLEQSATWSIRQEFAGADQAGHVELRGVAEGTSQLQLDAAAVLERQSSNAEAHIKERIILFDGAKARALPVLRVETDLVAGASHAASVAPIDREMLLYAASRGIAPTVAREHIITGFLT